MTRALIRRLHREDEGYALIIAILLLSVMMVLMVVSLDAANGSLNTVSRGSEWSKTLTVAEAGVHDVITRLGESRTATNPCAIATSTTCSGGGGEYQVTWTGTSTGGILVTSKGYFPSMSAPRFTREVQVTYEPVPTFKYALFAQDALSIKNNPSVVGDIYSSGSITVDQNVTICGGIISANGTITLGNNDQVVTSNATTNCTGQSAMVWAGGSIVGSSGVIIAGNATASAPSGTTCNAANATYSISTVSATQFMQVQGSGGATACGSVSAQVLATNGAHAGTATTPPEVQTMPAYVFDPNNYPVLVCYPTGGTCGANTSTTAASSFNTYVSSHKNNLTGQFAIWQRNPTASTYVNLDGLTNISGDVTIVTNAPINFGNTSTITTSAATAQMTVISLYQPPSGTTCQDGGGDCSIYGNNNIKFNSGSPTDPNDGVVGLLYTTGKLSFKNRNNNAQPWEGALYANSMDMKNGFDLTYNARIERTLGFGAALQQVLWQEINL